MDKGSGAESESDPNFWYDPKDWYDKVAEGDELRHFKHLREVWTDTPNFRVQLKCTFPEGKITIKHEFLKPGQDLSEIIDNDCIVPLVPLMRMVQPMATMPLLADQITRGTGVSKKMDLGKMP